LPVFSKIFFFACRCSFRQEVCDFRSSWLAKRVLKFLANENLMWINEKFLGCKNRWKMRFLRCKKLTYKNKFCLRRQRRNFICFSTVNVHFFVGNETHKFCNNLTNRTNECQKKKIKFDW
jgi:hypothetical protein